MATRTSTAIHPTAVVSPEARIGEGTTIGAYAVIGPNVTIGRDCTIGPHAVIDCHTVMGDRNQIFAGAVVGAIPQDLKYKGEASRVEIGDDNRIREYATISGGTGDVALTRIGSHCLTMANSHVGHDCWLGDHVILANSVALAGFVAVEDWASIGGLSGVHQFCRIGQHAFIGGLSKVTKDVPPFALADGHPLRVHGPNVIGLQRRGFTEPQIRHLKRAFRLLCEGELNTSQAVDAMRPQAEESAETADLIDFIEVRATRGILK